MRTIAIVNQKGGVGKSSVSANLAALAGAKNPGRVLAIDADPQYALTRQLLDAQTAASALLTIGDVLRQEQRIPDVTVPSTSAPGVDLIPASRDLAADEIGLVSATRREERLARAFAEVPEDLWDLCLIDSPPNLGLLTVNAIAACDEVLVPVSAEDEGSVQGVLQVLMTLDDVYGTQEPPKVSLVITKWDKARETAQAVDAAVGGLDRVNFLGKLPNRALHHKAPVLRQPAVLLAEGKKVEREAVNKAYRKLAKSLEIEVAA